MKIPSAWPGDRGTAPGSRAVARMGRGLAASTLLTAILLAGCSSAPTVGGATSGSDRPVIVNHDEILQARRHEYRTTGMMAQGVADTTVVQMLVDTLGSVEDVKVGISSENETVDQAALRVARVHRFEPARNRGKAVSVWVSLSVSFVPGLCDTEPMPTRVLLPNFAGFRGLGSEATAALLVGVDGLVRAAKIETSSGSPDFDQAVLDDMRKSRFQPGTIDCKPAEKWTTMKFGRGRRMDER